MRDDCVPVPFPFPSSRYYVSLAVPWLLRATRSGLLNRIPRYGISSSCWSSKGLYGQCRSSETCAVAGGEFDKPVWNGVLAGSQGSLHPPFEGTLPFRQRWKPHGKFIHFLETTKWYLNKEQVAPCSNYRKGNSNHNCRVLSDTGVLTPRYESVTWGVFKASDSYGHASLWSEKHLEWAREISAFTILLKTL